MPLKRYALLAIAAAAIAWPGRSVAVSGQAPQGARPRPIVGIVEVPRLFGLDVNGNRISRGPAIRLRSLPAADALVVAAISLPEALESSEYGYEEVGALAYARDRGWTLVRGSTNVAGWLAPDDAGPFHSLEMLLDEGQTYLTEAWDGFVSSAPAAADRVRLPPDPRRLLAGYVVAQEQRVRMALEPGQDPEEIRQRFNASGMRSLRGANGVRILDLETGITVPVFERPDPFIGIVTYFETHRSELVLETTGQTPQQVLVFDSRPGWFEVALSGDDWRNARRVWLQASSLWRYYPAADEAEARRLATDAWGPEDWSVNVVGFRTVDGALWINVEVLSESDCVSAGQPTVRARGWIRAHAANGAPTVWFHSRGC